MNCAWVEERILDYIYGELGHDVSEGFERHLHECPKCRKAVSDLKQVRGVLGRLCEQEFPARLEADILRKAHNPPPRKKSLIELLKSILLPRPAVGMGLATALALTIFIVYNYPKLSKEAQIHSNLPRQDIIIKPSSIPAKSKTGAIQKEDSDDEYSKPAITSKKKEAAKGAIDEISPELSFEEKHYKAKKRTSGLNEAKGLSEVKKSITVAQEPPAPKTNKEQFHASIEPVSSKPASVWEKGTAKDTKEMLRKEEGVMLEKAPLAPVIAKERQYAYRKAEEARRQIRRAPAMNMPGVEFDAEKEAFQSTARLASNAPRRSTADSMMEYSKVKKQFMMQMEEAPRSAPAPAYSFSDSRPDSIESAQSKLQTAKAYILQKDYRKAYETYTGIILCSAQAAERKNAWEGFRTCMDKIKNFKEALDFIDQYEKNHPDIDTPILAELKDHFTSPIEAAAP